MAQSAYTATFVSGTPQALGPNGQILTNTQATTTSPCSYCFGGVQSTTTNTYAVTGANGVGSTSLGSTVNQGYQTGVNLFTLESWSAWNASGYGYTPSTPTITAGGQTNDSAGPLVYNFVGVNNAGAVAANINFQGRQDAPIEGDLGAVANANGTITYLGYGSNVTGLNAAGTVSYNQATNPYSDPPSGKVLTAGSVTPTVVTDLGHGSTALAINASGQVTGSLFTVAPTNYTSDPYSYDSTLTGPSRAYRSGANGSGTGQVVFGTGPGVSSTGLAINDSGIVGGYITLSSGQDEAFLTTSHGGLLVGLGTTSPTDSTATLFVNNSGQAIVEDMTTDRYYFYNAGAMVDVAALGGGTPEGDPVIGFNNLGEILLSDPDLLQVVNASNLSASNILSSGGFDVTTTQGFQDIANSQGVAPDASFFNTPNTSTDSSFTAYNSSSYQSPVGSGGAPAGGGSSVPEPGMFGLAGIGAMLLALGRRRRGIVGV
jgi:hypothetical protein